MPAADNDRQGFTASYLRLRSAQKTSKGAPAYSLYINRPLGRVLAAAAFQLGLTPNQVTYLSAIISFTGIAMLATQPLTWWVGPLVSLALVLGYALDSADGQLARLRDGGSRAGEWLDHIIDSAKISSLHLAVLITAYHHFHLPSPTWLLVPIVFTVVAAVNFFGMVLVEQLAKLHRAENGIPTPPQAPGTPLRTLLKIPTDYGVLCLIFVLLGAPLVFLCAYGLLAIGSAGYLLLVLPKWYADIARLDRFAPVTTEARQSAGGQSAGGQSAGRQG
jgi:phosphatidylglycerophosphate synthase